MYQNNTFYLKHETYVETLSDPACITFLLRLDFRRSLKSGLCSVSAGSFSRTAAGNRA